MPERTSVHIALAKGKIIEMFLKRVRGEARVSSGGAAGSVRPSLETFLMFYSFSLCPTKCVERPRVRGMSLSSVVLRCCWCLRVASSQTISLELLVLLLPLLVVSPFPDVGRCVELLSVELRRPVGAGDVLEFQHLRYDGSSQESSLGLVYDNLGGEAFNVLLFWIEDVGLREWLVKMEVTVTPGCMPQARLVTLTLQNPHGFTPVQPRLTMFPSVRLHAFLPKE